MQDPDLGLWLQEGARGSLTAAERMLSALLASLLFRAARFDHISPGL